MICHNEIKINPKIKEKFDIQLNRRYYFDLFAQQVSGMGSDRCFVTMDFIAQQVNGTGSDRPPWLHGSSSPRLHASSVVWKCVGGLSSDHCLLFPSLYSLFFILYPVIISILSMMRGRYIRRPITTMLIINTKPHQISNAADFHQLF